MTLTMMGVVVMMINGNDNDGGGEEMVDNVTTRFHSFNGGSHLLESTLSLDAIVFSFYLDATRF